MKKKAFKKNYGFLSEQRAEKYSIFLKKNLLNLKPKYYVITQCKKIITYDCVMYALCITTNIEFHNHEPIAECWINGSDIYLWRDRCWGIAVDKNNKEIVQIAKTAKTPFSLLANAMTVQTTTINKTILIFPIGVDEVT